MTSLRTVVGSTAGLGLVSALACSPQALSEAEQAAPEIFAAASVPADLVGEFDANPSPRDGYRVVGAYTPPSWSWGEIELLEGYQLFRTEGYNRRSAKILKSETFDTTEYPLGTYMGSLNQQLVDGFNLYYKSSCTDGKTACPSPGPTKPEARFVLLQKGPKTKARTCRTDLTPMVLVHGASQDGNIFLFPGGNDGAGGAYPGTVQKTGLVQAMEAAGRCVYAVSFGNFHGDTYSQAINLRNAIARVRELHKKADGTLPKVDVLGWSKGVLTVDAYLGNAATWTYASTRYFDRLATAQAAQVPRYGGEVRTYIALSGPHKGIDLNFRHPIHVLTIASMPWNVGRAPIVWTWYSALQCVTFGPDVPWYDNPYAKSICEGRGGTWPDFFNRIYLSNITSLDATGKPVAPTSLKTLNIRDGAPAATYTFDEYNLSMFGAVDDSGKHVSGFLGQLQAAYDLRSVAPVPRRDSSDWKDMDPDEARFFPWLRPKLTYLGGGYLDDPDRTACRKAAYLPSASPCVAWHLAYNSRNAEGSSGFYNKYQLIGGLGVDAAVEMGGHFIDRLSARGLDSRIDSLYVLYGEGNPSPAPGTVYETDAMSCPKCDPKGDSVLFLPSIAAVNQLTQGWTTAKKAMSAKQESVPVGHLEAGITPSVFDKVIAHVKARD